MLFKKKVFSVSPQNKLKKTSLPIVRELPLNWPYKFLYENFVISTQHQVYLILENNGEEIRGLKFNSTVYKYGYPNDEAGHPLMQYGLGFYGFYQVENSAWIEGIREHNSVHPRDTEQLHEGKKHFIVTFKDVTFEAIANEFQEFQISPEEMSSIVHQELEKLVKD